MKVNIAIEHMSKLYLDKVINSFTTDIKKFSEEESRNFIHKNSKDFLDIKHISERLMFKGESYQDRIVLRLMLRFLLCKTGYEVAESKIAKEFTDYQANWLKRISNKEIQTYIKKEKRNTLEVLLEVILEDGSVSADEEKILSKITERFCLTNIEMHSLGYGISRNFYLKVDNKACSRLIKVLMNEGLVYFLNKGVGHKKIIIPEEIALFVAQITSYPLDKKSYELLFSTTPKNSLVEVCKQLELPVSGSKKTITDRLWDQGYSARKLLEIIDVASLRDIARFVDNIKVSGRKNEVIENILNHFFNLETEPLNTPKKQDLKALWAYFPLFANRNYTKLRQLKLISKDLDIEHQFEKLTKYAFSEIAGSDLVAFDGSNNPDGGVLDDKGNVMIWDNKSQEDEYTFPNSHQKQFLQYVKKSDRNVTSFLIITGTVNDHKKVMNSCIVFESQSGVNVAVVEAVVFKAFIDSLSKKKYKKPLNIQIFNHNGVLDLQVLEQRFNVFN